MTKKSSNDHISHFKSPQHKNKEDNIPTKRLNSQTKTKEKLNINHLQCSPVHRSIQNSIDNLGQSPFHSKPIKSTVETTKNNNISVKIAQSPERKTERPNILLDNNIAKNNNLSTISHGERNMVPRSISPIVNIGNFNNTTNSLKDGQNTNTNNNNINASPNHNGNNDKSTIDRNSKIDRKYVNIPPKLTTKPIALNVVKKTTKDINSIKKLVNNSSNTSSTTNSNNVTPNQPKKLVATNIPILLDIKKDKNVLNTIVDLKSIKGNVILDKKNDKKISIVTKIESTDNKGNSNNNYLNQKLPEKLSSEKLINDKNKKEVTFKKPEQKNNVLPSKLKLNLIKDKEKSEDNEYYDNLVQKKQSEFACCTINDIVEIQSKLSKYCEENNVQFKDVQFMN